jgi:hypothetical protein
MFKKIKNILDDNVFNNVKQEVCSNEFPWFYTSNSASQKEDTNKNKNFSFYHTTLNEGNPNSFFNEKTKEIAEIMKKKFKLDNYTITRLRWGMTTNSNKKIINEPHIDMKSKHMVILYYLNKSDGNTYFYDNDTQIINSNEPEENSAILFDGSLKHSSSKPYMYDRRIVLNINLQNHNTFKKE